MNAQFAGDLQLNDLGFTGFHVGATTVLDGNLVANSASISATITGLTWANGDDFWLVWN